MTEEFVCEFLGRRLFRYLSFPKKADCFHLSKFAVTLPRIFEEGKKDG